MNLSLIIPCYNEEPHLKKNVNALIQVLKENQCTFEIIFVDDCSIDSTREIIKEICQGNTNYSYIFNEKNLGRGGAFKNGFLKSKGEIVGFIDIDLEIAPHYIPLFLENIAQNGFDLAIGNRAQFFGFKKPIRNIISLAYKHICFLALGIKKYDTQVGCKFFKRSTTEHIIIEAKDNHWFWDTEVVYGVQLKKLKIVEVPVKYESLSNKQSTVKIVSDTIYFLKALRQLRRQMGLSFSNKSPLYWTAKGYNWAMLLLFRKNYQTTFKNVSELIPKKTTVIDVCGGTSELFLKHLKQKECIYQSLDYNTHFIKSLTRAGVGVRHFDVRTEKVPSAEYVVMISSFYHFKDIKDQVLQNMFSSAQKAVIISEPVSNLSEHRSYFISKLARKLSKPGSGSYRDRFNLSEFREFAKSQGATEFYFKSDDKNAIAVFRK